MHVNNTLPATPSMRNAHITLERIERKEQSQCNSLIKRFIKRGERGRFVFEKKVIAIVL